MIIKNPDKLLKQFIPTNNDLWYVTELNLTMYEDSVAYTYKISTDVPVKSSPNQQYYHMTRRLDKEVTLRITGHVYELYCDGCALHGYCKDIDSLDKFIKRIADILPNNF
jgi:hypothetical protein